MNIIHWFHHLFTPHCPQCMMDNEVRTERENRCKSCEILERQLEIERQYNRVLLDKLTNTVIQADEPEVNKEELKPIMRSKRSFVPFSVKEQMARENDEQTLILLKKHHIDSLPPMANEEIVSNEEKVEKLEQEILGTNVLEQVK